MSNPIETWLKRQITTRVAACWLGVVLALLGGLVLLFLTFWFTYAILWFGETGVSAISQIIGGTKLHLLHKWRLVVCGGFVAALFIERLMRSGKDTGDYDSPNSSMFTNTLVFHTGTMGAFAALLANPQGSSSMITEFLYIGQRLVIGTWKLARQARLLAHMDQSSCAWVLAALISRPGAMTHEELQGAWPEADWQAIRNQLSSIPGIVFLEKGLSLTGELREELIGLSATQRV